MRRAQGQPRNAPLPQAGGDGGGQVLFGPALPNYTITPCNRRGNCPVSPRASAMKRFFSGGI